MRPNIKQVCYICLFLMSLSLSAAYPQPASSERNSWFTSWLKEITGSETEDSMLSLTEAQFYTKKSGGDVQCQLCPHRCVLASNERGACRVRINKGGTLKTVVYGKPIAVHIDPIEKKPLFHFLPRSLAFSLATAGCNLNCIFCQNWQISQAFPDDTEHYDLSPQQLVREAVQAQARSIAYTYTEPTIFYEYMLETAKLAKAEGIKNVLVTCGYINPEPLKSLASYIDAANVDLKGFSEEFYQKYTTGHLDPVLTTLKILKQNQVHLEITNLIIPGANDDFKTIEKMCEWIRINLGANCPLHFSRFFPHYKLQNKPPTPLATLEQARAIALKAGLQYVYIGNIRTAYGENTYCPGCKNLLVEREGYYIKQNNIIRGLCTFCGERIYGVWE